MVNKEKLEIYVNKLYERKSKGRPYLYLHLPSAICRKLGLSGTDRVNRWIQDGKTIIEKSINGASKLYERKSKNRPYLYFHLPSAICKKLSMSGVDYVNIWTQGGKIIIEKSLKRASELG